MNDEYSKEWEAERRARARSEAENRAIREPIVSDYDRGLEDAAKLADQLLEVYPEDVFTPITAAETKPLGALCDRISAHMGRHVARLLASDIRALKSDEREDGTTEASDLWLRLLKKFHALGNFATQHTVPEDQDGPCTADGGECAACGILACEYDDPLHFHHDGCPTEYAHELERGELP